MGYQPPFALPNEFRLAAGCCRWVPSGEGSDEIAELARLVGWGMFLQTCRRHRIQGLAWRTLSGLAIDMPPPVEIALSTDARGIAEHGLRAAAESKQLADAFASVGLPLMFLKGLTLGQLAYADPFVKMGCDIDVLVDLETVTEAGSILSKLGYAVQVPKRTAALARWHASRKESVWRNSNGLVVELHSRLADQPELLPGITVHSERQIVPVGPGIDLPTLGDEDLFAYLCVHGASSAWFRLKWIADLAALLDRRGQHDLQRLYDRACQLGAARAAAQALLLMQWLFGLCFDPALNDRLANRTNRWLASSALKEMLRGEPTERPLGTCIIHLTQFFLLPGWRYKFCEFSRQVRAAAGGS